MIDRPVTIFLSAAEASGDERGAQLVAALRRRLPQARLVGAAGPKMAQAGCEVLVDLTDKAAMVAGAFFRAGYFIRQISRLKKAIRSIRPDVHVPVDSPALNWHLAAAAKQCGAKVLYYVAPQIWAWAPWRARKLARLADHVACILPFEQAYLRSRGIPATFVGHPLFDLLPPRPDPLPDLADAWLDGSWRVAMLPGSRPAEIGHHTPAILEVSRAIRDRWPKARCTLLAHTDSAAAAIRKACKGKTQQAPDIQVGRTRQVLAESHFAVAKSGTITLELAHFGVPMVVFYRVNAAVALAHRVLGRWAVPTPSFSLVNILAGRRAVPEMIPWRGGAKALKAMVLDVMDDLGCLVDLRRRLLEIVKPLRAPGPQSASDNAADLVCRLLEGRV